MVYADLESVYDVRMSERKGIAREQLSEVMGRVFDALGLRHSTGVIFGAFYFSQEPLSLDDLTEILGISKGAASTGVRDLVSFGAIREVFRTGDRREYFEIHQPLEEVAKAVYEQRIGPAVRSVFDGLNHVETALQIEQKGKKMALDDARFYEERLAGLLKVSASMRAIADGVEWGIRKL
jgi:HTH-type transcriptional regulator, glycine betaine synthesis regulator